MTLNCIHLNEVDSTNSYLKQHRAECPDGTLVTADIQTAGKGRRGHGWLADGGMLPFSLLLKSPKHADTLTLCAAVAVCESLEALLPDEQFGIKWPNDIILRGHKLCGILCESVCFGSSIDVVCGIGINLAQPADFFAQAGLPHGGSLKMLTGFEPADRVQLACDIAGRLYEYSQDGFSAVYGGYKRRCLTLGREIRIISGDEERRAIAEDIAPNGFLICSDESGRFEVNSGEVSVRGLLDYI